MTLAYVITAHKNPGQFRRMLAAVYAAGNVYVLHVDRKAAADVHAVAREFAAAHPRTAAVLPSLDVVWGSWNLARAQLAGMAAALRLSGEWSYLLNLTAQDYPLRTQPEIASVLAAGPAGANYLEVLDFAKAAPNARKRLLSYWVPWRGKMRRLWRRRERTDVPIYWGSNYVALTRPACEFAVTSDVSRQFQRHFRWTLCADELIFQNVIMHGPFKDTVVRETHRHLVWQGGSHPKTFTLTDRDELLAADAWFARKFDDTVDAKILDELDAALATRQAPAGA